MKITFLFLLFLPATLFAQNQQEKLIELADNLETCSAFTQEFEHPFTGDTLERNITKTSDAECTLTESMPNGFLMTCTFSEAARKSVASYYRDLSGADSFGTQTSQSLDESGEQTTTYTINGKEVENPLQESMENGTCVVSQP
ncbi:hypothetical protein [Rhodohalobacter sp. 614A]|uniref:hypothetical protein n=1 Tax=Rhodohalobacter sp. 614A TaxID=2908649 RepID=UPI001F4658E5|nr:hypothetical protein [Rhodohalobacter sp. 614A]